MDGIIRIEDYKIHCIVGAHPHERHDEQELLLDVEMKFNMLEVAQTDSLVDTVNYDEVGKTCTRLAKGRQYRLLETLAYEMLHAILDDFPIVWAKVRVKKPGALPLAKHVVVELEKEK